MARTSKKKLAEEAATAADTATGPAAALGGTIPATAAGWQPGDWLLLSREDKPPVPGRITRLRKDGEAVFVEYAPHLWVADLGTWQPYVGTAWQTQSDSPTIKKVLEPKAPDVFVDAPAVTPPPPLVEAIIEDGPTSGASPATLALAKTDAGAGTAERAFAIAVGFLSQEAETKFLSVREKTDALVTQAATLAVNNAEDVATAAGVMKEIKATSAAAEKLRELFTGPIDTAKKAFQAIFVPRQGALEAARKTLDKKILDYNRRVAAESAAQASATQQAFASMSFEEAIRVADACPDPAEAQRIRCAAIDRRTQIATAPVYVPAPVTAPGLQVKDVWTWELASGGRETVTPQAIADLQALCYAIAYGQVPADLVSLNAGAIQRLIREGHRALPGLRIFQTQQTAVAQ